MTLSRRLAAAVSVAVLVLAAGDASPRPSSGSRLTFHGWSRDSRLVAYTRERFGRDKDLQRMHRFVRDGAFAGFGRMVGGDVSSYARDKGYVATPVPRRELGPGRWEMRVGERTYALTFEVGRDVSWVLAEGERVIARHTFDRIYITFDPEIYPSPDETQAVVVMHLDTGWETDAAVFPVALGGASP